MMLDAEAIGRRHVSLRRHRRSIHEAVASRVRWKGGLA